MSWKFWKKTEQKSDIVQFQGGVYYLGTSNISQLKLKNYLQAYKLSDAVYSVVNKISDAAMQIPWYVYRQRGERTIQVSSHALVNFIESPGKNMSWPQYIKKKTNYFLLAGNVYVRKLIGSMGQYGEVEFMRPDKVRIKTNALGISSYEYNLQGNLINIDPEEVLHVKMFNPQDDLYGLSPVDTIARIIDIGTLNQAWLISFLENEAMIGGKITSKGLTADQRERIKSQIKTEYGGVLNAGKWLVLEGETDAERFAVPIKDMDNTPLEKMILRKICSIYRVPSELFGDAENKTYSNQKEARKALYEDAALPILRLFRDELNSWIVPDFDKTQTLFLDYDTSNIEALSEDLQKIWDRAVKSTGGVPFLDRNEAREMLKYGKRTGLSTLTIPMNQLPVEGSEKPQKAVTIEQKAKKPSFWQKKENKERLWQNFDLLVKAKAQVLINPVSEYLKEQRESIAKKIKKVKDIEKMSKNLSLIFNEEEEAEKYTNKMSSIYLNLVQTAGEAGMAACKGELYSLEQKQEFGFEITELVRDQVAKIVAQSGQKINEVTASKIIDKLTEAQIEGWTIEELGQNLLGSAEELGTWFNHNRARRIAQTEMVHIENYGQTEGYKQDEAVNLKGWLCAFLPDSRDEHMMADAHYSDNPIPLDEPFDVGGEQMDYPGDDSYGASAGNIINCHCSTYPEVGEV